LKTRIALLSLLTIVCLTLVVAPAMAGILYSNGPYNGNTNAWVIGPPYTGYAVSDSFTCSGSTGCSVEGLSIVTWNYPGDSLTNVEMQLGSTSFGTDYKDEILTPSTSTSLGSNQYGYSLEEYGFTFSNVQVPNGTSWITLSNGNTGLGNPIYWDENSGSSSAYWNSLGSIPSESFTLTGTTNGPPPTTPEPSSIMLFGSGILGLAGVLRRKVTR